MTGKPLLSDAELETSSVVANNAMNRERGLVGVNSYTKDLGFDPLEWLRQRVATAGGASWLDLCCGTGRALIQAARQQVDGLHLIGVDLVGYFDGHDRLPNLRLVASSVVGFQPDRTFDLITCVHGLHYLGDKLGGSPGPCRGWRPEGSSRPTSTWGTSRWMAAVAQPC